MNKIQLKEPLFSVLIANYNNGKYLMDAIESVRQQTYANVPNTKYYNVYDRLKVNN